MRPLILSLLIVYLGVSDAGAQCRNCGPRPNLFAPSPLFAPAPTAGPKEPAKCAVRGESCDCGCLSGEACRCTLTWSTENQHEGHYALLRGGRQIGSYDPTGGVWRSYTNGEWGPKESSPPDDAPPLPSESRPPVSQNFGVDRSKLKGEESYHLNGRKATRKQAIEAIEANVPDDVDKLRLTVIGGEADRKRVLADIDTHPALAEVKGRVLVQSYPADHWAVAKAGFVTTGAPTIYVQQPDGRVLHRQDAYAGPEPLAEAVRKADPNYQPKNDPDLNRPALAGGAPGAALVILGGLAAVLLYLRSQR